MLLVCVKGGIYGILGLVGCIVRLNLKVVICSVYLDFSVLYNKICTYMYVVNTDVFGRVWDYVDDT